MAYTIQHQTKKLGPYDLGQVRAMAEAGEVSGADLVWKEGSSVPTTVAVLLQGAEGEASPDVESSATSPPVFKKGAALTSFYLAALGLIPGIGIFCAIPAIFFGLKGLKDTKADPQSRERMHALVGVFVGGFLTLMYALVITFVFMKMMKPAGE
ncbi:DUF4339 domain-containing protein [Roseimicrobium gellanilyticum]|nr:DUF4339 domain-containing protein [Roseimicrobium gellanilyticum]